MKRKAAIRSGIAMGGGLLLAALIVFLLTRQGFIGLLQWNPQYKIAVIVLSALALLPISFGLTGTIFSVRGPEAAGATLAIAAPIGGAFAILGPSLSLSPSIPPMLLLEPSGEGAYSAGVFTRGGERPADAYARADAPRDGAMHPYSFEGKALGSFAFPAGGGSPRFRAAFASDPHFGKESADGKATESILRSINSSPDPFNAFFILGDNVEMGMFEAAWKLEAKTLSALIPNVPVRPLLGNHDAIVDGQYHFRRYFFPEGMKSDSGSPFYYRIDSGTAHIIVLDLLWGMDSYGSAQDAWLRKQLAEIPREDFTAVLSHAFFYCSGYVDPDTRMPWYDHFETTKRLSPLFEKSGVDLVVSGHNHYMELLRKNGVAYAIIGSMGGKLDPEPEYRSPYSAWFRRGFGFLDLDIRGNRAALAFRDENGAELAGFTVP
jgi:hypothetical protein